MMLTYKTLVVGELQTNCYLIWNKSKDCLIIDPGDEGVEIGEEIRSLGLKPLGVVATHGHFDHVMGVLDLKLIYKIPFSCSERDKFLLDRCQETASYYLKREVKVPKITIDNNLALRKQIKIGGEELEIIQTPGHTPGGVCFYSQKNKILFSGDTVFAGSVGRTDYSYGSKEELGRSLKSIYKLEMETLILPGHGKETRIAREKTRFEVGK
jgi:glyoxylase-like metal-dependent hydrolase (beta-lactamase superfamily II)